VLRGVDLESEVVEVPARERARALAHVLLGVVADAHREELHDLAREVLVRCPLHVELRVEEIEHRGILRDLDREVAEVAGCMVLEERDLLEHLAVVADLVLVRREVAVPQQRHLLLERMRGGSIGSPPLAHAARLEHRARNQ
jgi:hypothetical protein